MQVLIDGGGGSKPQPIDVRGILGIKRPGSAGLNMRGCSKQPH